MWKSSTALRESAASTGAASVTRANRTPDEAAEAGALALEPKRPLPDIASLPKRKLRAMLSAGMDILECRRVLGKGGLNLVGEVLRGQKTFVEYEHYPENDVYDPDTHSQYYYHAHRGMAGEHGHFHTFLRLSGPAAGAAGRAEQDGPVPLIAISMDAYGWPIGLFATNRWVTGGLWVPANEAIDLLPSFRIDHAYPSWPVNRWISAMFSLFRPHIESLLRHRDIVIAARGAALPGTDVLEDRELEVTGSLPVSVEETVTGLRALLNMEEST
jgi:hypothetical protein